MRVTLESNEVTSRRCLLASKQSCNGVEGAETIFSNEPSVRLASKQSCNQVGCAETISLMIGVSG